jgi:hypothetical protein
VGTVELKVKNVGTARRWRRARGWQVAVGARGRQRERRETHGVRDLGFGLSSTVSTWPTNLT